jgi:uncharacterized membrane protein
MPDVPFATALLAVIHVLAGAAWLGAMCYSFFVLHPRAHAYFEKQADFESFIAAVSHGARYWFLSALAVIALSGAGLLLGRWPETVSAGWVLVMGAKVGLLATALVLFVYVSWRLWPARILALDREIPHLQKVFRRAALAMLLIAALSMALGVLAHT